MAYRIEYDSGSKKYEVRHVSRLGRYTAAFLLLFLFLVSSFWPAGREALHQILFPGDNGAVTEALEVFAEDIHSGSGAVQAMEAFCREIIAGAPHID